MKLIMNEHGKIRRTEQKPRKKSTLLSTAIGTDSQVYLLLATNTFHLELFPLWQRGQVNDCRLQTYLVLLRGSGVLVSAIPPLRTYLGDGSLIRHFPILIH